MATHLIVDAANVVGSRPDGWWRDRVGAARRLLDELGRASPESLARLVGHDEPPVVHVVLEGTAKPAARDRPADDALRIVLAPHDGDGAIAELAGSLRGEPVTVVTADRGLRDRVRAVGAATIGPGTLHAAL